MRPAHAALAALTLSALPVLSVEVRADELVSRLRAHVEYLASDALAGRDPGTEGIAMAERHVADVFAQLGLLPVPGFDDHFLDFELERDSFDPACTKLLLDMDEARLDLAPGADFRPFDFSGVGHAASDVVFAGYGITASEHGWDDYDGLDVRGRVVLVLRHEPNEADPKSLFAGAESTTHATFTTKAENARSHGAVGILVVTDPLHHDAADDLRWGGAMRLPGGAGGPAGSSRPAPGPASPNGAAGPDAPPIMALQISKSVAQRIVAAAGLDLAELQLDMDAGVKPSSLDVQLPRIDLSVGRRAEPETIACRNVAGYLPGSDLALCEEWIVIGAHHDHLGAFDGPGDTIYNGADDNASGTASVLELARLFAQAPEPPRRSIVFMTFSAEEKGLLGSRWLVERSPFPLERVAFMLNNDMLGRNPEQPIEAIGDGFVRGLFELVSDESQGLGLDLAFGGDGYFGASDHDPFYKRDVPFMFFFTGLHDDYHQLGDHADLLSYEREARIVELSRRVARRLADDTERPAFIHHVPWLGLESEVVGKGTARVAVITQVNDGSRASRLDLRAGDVLTAFAGEPLSDPGKVGERFRAIAPGTTAVLTLARGASRLDVELARPRPGMIGISPGNLEVDERRKLGLREDEGMVVRSVTPDGPASKAGVKDGDIITRLAGQPVSQRSLQGILAQAGAGETVDALILRDGKTQTLRITLAERPERR